MTSHGQRRLSLVLFALTLIALPPALLAASNAPETPPHLIPSVSIPTSLLATLGSWFGAFWPETRCTADPNGGQICSPSGGNQPAPSSGRRTISRKASAGGSVSTETRCTIDPNGGQVCTPGSPNQLSAPQ